MEQSNQGWTDSSTTLTRWRVMRAMVEPTRAGDFARSRVISDQLGIEGKAVGETFDQLGREGLAVCGDRALAPGYTTDAKLRPEGLEQVERWASVGGSTLRRSCRSALLNWLDSVSGTHRTTSVEAFLADVRGCYYGEPFPREVVERAAEELFDLGLFEGISSFGRPPLSRAELTATGERVVSRYGGDVDAWQEASEGGRSSVSITNSPGANVAQNSPHAHQRSTVSVPAREKLHDLADAAERMLPDLQETERAQAREHVDELRELAKAPEADPGKARGVVSAVREIAVSAVGSAAGTGLVALAPQVAGLAGQALSLLPG